MPITSTTEVDADNPFNQLNRKVNLEKISPLLYSISIATG